MLLEACKGTGLNQNMGPGDLYYVAANTSWMVWNTLVNNMASGAAVVTYAGSPTYGRKDRQFEVLAATGATMFGVGAAYLTLVEQTGLEPGRDWDLSQLTSILSTGSLSRTPPGHGFTARSRPMSIWAQTPAELISAADSSARTRWNRSTSESFRAPCSAWQCRPGTTTADESSAMWVRW